MTSGPVVVRAGRPLDDRALRWAAAEAARRGVPLRIVVPAAAPEPPAGTSAGSPGDAFAEALVVARKSAPGVVVTGGPVPAAGAAALRELSADAAVVVVAAAEPDLADVVADAYCPVAVVPGTDPPRSGPVVLGATPWTCEEAFDLAFREAAARGAPLEAVRAVDETSTGHGYHPAGIGAAARQARRELEVTLAVWATEHPGVDVRALVVEDPPAMLLADLSHRAQLLVLGRSVRGVLLAGRAGSPVDAIAHGARCPVLVVPADGPPRDRWLPAGPAVPFRRHPSRRR
ncbi:MAG TPA: universal stress protein [Pseudonocardia sp.]|nr:universal stress protein [Pseudonocardia sp.]